MSSQTPHIQRLLLTAFVTGIPEHKVRCISPDVGGAFGSKIFCYADMALVMFASKLIGGRPVKWVEGRRESYGSTIHGRDHITYVEVAANRNGEVKGLRVKTLANLGGRLSTIGPGIPTTLYGRVLAGPYKIPNVYCEVTGVYTNTDVRRRVPRRRPPGGDLRRRAGDGPRRRRAGHRPGRGPAAELPAARRRSRTTTRRACCTAVNGAKLYIDSGNYEPALDKALDDGRLRRPGGDEGRGEGAAASSSASACRPTSRSAASRPRSGSAPSARAGAPRCGSRPTSGST